MTTIPICCFIGRQDINISSNNRWSISSNTDNGKQKITNQQRYAPGTAIDGLVDIKNPHNQMFSNGTFSATLEAHKTYEFKILETSTLYGLNDLIATSSISNQTLNTSGYQVRLCTAGAGTYTFGALLPICTYGMGLVPKWLNGMVVVL